MRIKSLSRDESRMWAAVDDEIERLEVQGKVSEIDAALDMFGGQHA